MQVFILLSLHHKSFLLICLRNGYFLNPFLTIATLFLRLLHLLRVLSLFFGLPLHFEVGYLLDFQLIFETPQVVLYLRLLLLLFQLAVKFLLSTATLLLLEDGFPFLLLHSFLQSSNLRIFLFLLLRHVSVRGLLALSIYASKVIIVPLLFTALRSLHLRQQSCLPPRSLLSLQPLLDTSPVLLKRGLIHPVQPKLDLSVNLALLTELLLLLSLELVLLLSLCLFELLFALPEVDVLSPALLLPLDFLLVVTLDLVFQLFLALSLGCRFFLLPDLLLALGDEGVMGSLDKVLGKGFELAL